jgi:hypothetical protein
MYRSIIRSLVCLSGILLALSSCMKDRPEELPGNLVWNPELAFPLGQDRFGMDAASGFDTTLFEIDTLTSLPQWVNELNIVMEGTVPIQITSLSESTDDIQRVLFRVNIYNGFPHEALAQAYFQDSTGNLLDSMFAGGAIPLRAGRILGNGETIEPSSARQDAEFGSDRINALLDATEIVLRAVIANPEVDPALVSFYRDYHIDVDVGVMLELHMEF